MNKQCETRWISENVYVARRNEVKAERKGDGEQKGGDEHLTNKKRGYV